MQTITNDGIAENKKNELEREYYNLKYIYSKLDDMFKLSDALNKLYNSCGLNGSKGKNTKQIY